MKKLHFASLALLNLILISSCKKTDPLPVFDDVNAFYAKNKTEGSSFVVNTDGKADTINIASGMVIFPASAFDKSGNVNVKVKEILNPDELVLTDAPNNIDSSFNQNPVILEISADANLSSGKTYKVISANQGESYVKLSTATNGVWSVDGNVAESLVDPTAGDNNSVIFNSGNLVSFTYNKLGLLSLSKKGFSGNAKKTKVAIKIYGFTNTPTMNVYVIAKGKNAVNRAKRLEDSDFVSDSVTVGSSLQFVAINYNQNKKYVGFADAIIADSINVPISLSEVASESEIKTRIKNYFK